MIEIGVDIGGTFTDIVAIADRQGLAFTKVPSTPKDLLIGIRHAISRILDLAGARPADVVRFIHGTTVATNAVVERKGAVTAILMTEGFEDVLELGRQRRSKMYDLDMDADTPVFLAPRRRRVGIRERLDARGRVLVPLDEAAVLRVVERLREDEGIEAVAVCYLFSFLNPAHERRTRELIERHHPDLAVSLSSEVDPTFREYERVCVTAFDAYLRPLCARYLGGLDGALKALGVSAEPQIMQSRGGITAARMAAARPVALVLSGPAAGVVGAVFAAQASGYGDIISIDIGGTSSDVALVQAGAPLISQAGSVGGYPVRVPMVDVNTIGAGGGSIASIDAAGGLRVGPESAGADPGPACYGQGGSRATVTDASLVLGYLNPDYFAGGTLRLDPTLAHAAVAEVAGALGMDPVAAAAGIHRVINARMADQIRLVTIKRGYDPRGFALVLLGGAGPVHGVALAEELGIETVIVPEAPGVLSAFGLLVAAIEHSHSRTAVQDMRSPDCAVISRILGELDAQGRERMRAERVPLDQVEVAFAADMRYVGQAYELEVPLPPEVSPATIPAIVAAFHAVHQRVYSHHRPDDPVEIVNLRAVHRHPLPPPRLGQESRVRPSGAPALQGRRPAYFGGAWRATAVYERGDLSAGQSIAGPAIVEQADTTTVVPPGYTAVRDPAGNLLIRRAPPTPGEGDGRGQRET
ncbi:MAG: hydantoinase/oxoprolinase family protein [Candidatus Rokubacteria bacterium]|nr:hydantoinase/oxoprolinase family protein [Candidatus Rokubacteria bacterium]